MEKDQLERRACPCTHIVSLAEKTAGQIQSVTQEITHTKDTFESRMEILISNNEELQLGVKECLESMQKSALAMQEGTFKFQRLDMDISSIRNEMSAARASAKEHSIEKIRARVNEETHYRSEIEDRFKKIEWAVFIVAAVFIMSHGHTVVSYFERWAGR